MCNNQETWLDVPGYESLYQASTEGRIRSLDKYIGCKYGERLLKGRVLKLGRNKYGYLQLGLFKNGERKDFRVNRIILTVFDHPPKDNEECNHKDGNKANNFIDNLGWVTAKQNCKHKIEVLGRGPNNIGRFVGEKSVNAKLTNNEVREIRVLLKQGKLTQQQIAKKYKVNRSVITGINIGRTWKHVK